MRPANERASRVVDVLGDVLKRVDPEQQMRTYSIWNFWADEVGELIARRAQPSRFRNGILFVTVATQSWMQELQFMKEKIRERLNARLGAELVRDIFFVSGSITAPTPVESRRDAAAGAGARVVAANRRSRAGGGVHAHRRGARATSGAQPRRQAQESSVRPAKAPWAAAGRRLRTRRRSLQTLRSLGPRATRGL